MGNLYYANIAALVRSSSRFFILVPILLLNNFRNSLLVGSTLASLHLIIPCAIFGIQVFYQKAGRKVLPKISLINFNFHEFVDNDIKNFIRICSSSFCASLISSLFFFGTRTVMTQNLDLYEIGSYALLVTIGSSLMLIVQIVGFSFYPKIITLCDKNEFKLSYFMNIKVSMSLVLFSFLVSLLIALINSSTSVINLLTKSSYYQLLPLSILSYGFLVAINYLFLDF